MILRQLQAFRSRIDNEVIPAFHKEQKVRWFLEIGEDGRFLGLTETGKTKKEWTSVVAPYAKRSGSSPPPNLFVDKPDYVLGLIIGDSSDKIAKRHNAYISLVNACSESVKSPSVDAFYTFLSGPMDNVRTAAEEKGMKAGDLIAPRIGDTILCQLPDARSFWQTMQEERSANASTMESECLVCGRTAPIARTHPVELLVRTDRVSLITGNEDAFLSYGLKQSEIAPLCHTCAREYGEALRYLLGSPSHHIGLGKATWLFWTRKAADFDICSLLSNPEPEQVKSLLKSPWKGRAPGVEDEHFYAMAVSAAKSRMIVRNWLETSIHDVRATLARYFDHQAIADREGQVQPIGLFALIGALVQKPDDLPPQIASGLVEHALTGKPLPPKLLYMAVQRARADREYIMTRPRAAIIKLVLLSHHTQKEEFMVDIELTPAHPSRAYQCGRLLATLDEIQRAAVHAKATMVDRFYGSASAAPASVFGVLMRGVQPHLGKLRKTKPGLHYYFERQLGEITSHLDGFPRTLTMEEQGLFALGYYHQKNRPRTPSKPETDTNTSAHDEEDAS